MPFYVMGSGITITPTTFSSTIFQPFSQTITVSSGGTYGETISSITVSKTPTSGTGSATADDYESLTIKVGAGGTVQDFVANDSFTYTFADVSQVTFTLAGTVTDNMFTDQSIKYYNSPDVNSDQGIARTVSTPEISITRSVSDQDANPKINTYINKEIKIKTTSYPNTRDQYYSEARSWGKLPKTDGNMTVDAIWSFQASNSSAVPDYFTYNFAVTGTGGTLLGSGTTFSMTLSVKQTVNYDLNYQRERFQEALNNQRYKGIGSGIS